MAALNSSTVQVSWNPPQLSLQNGLIVDYVLTITGVDTDEEYELRSSEDTGGTMTVPGLHPFYTYTFSIAAATTVGGGPFSPAVAFQMPQEGMHYLKILFCIKLCILLWLFSDP